MRLHLRGLFAILIASLPTDGVAGDVFGEILTRVSLRDEATGAILRVKPRADSPPDRQEFTCVIEKAGLVRDGKDVVIQTYTVRVENVAGPFGEAFWSKRPTVYEQYYLIETPQLRTEEERWAAFEKARSEKALDDLVGRWVYTRKDLVSVVEFDRTTMKITIEDPSYPVKSLAAHYSFLHPHPLLNTINADYGDNQFRFYYRRNKDELYLDGNFVFLIHPSGGEVRRLEVPFQGYWRRERK